MLTGDNPFTPPPRLPQQVGIDEARGNLAAD
jgi:hypothetical protein